jgi:hypothetical protein
MYTSKKLPAIIADYKVQLTPFTPKKCEIAIRQLADQLTNLSLANKSCSLDLRKIYYVYLYLDTRHPARYENEFRYVLPSGRVVVLSHRPMYAGKGKGERLYAHLQETSSYRADSHKVRVLRKLEELGLEPIIISAKSLFDEATAFALEIDLIAGIGRHGLKTGPLTNLTDGGDGVSGYVFTANLRRRLSRLGAQRIQSMTKQEREDYHAKQQEGKRGMDSKKRELMKENIRRGTVKAYADMAEPKKQLMLQRQRIAIENRTEEEWSDLAEKKRVSYSQRTKEERKLTLAKKLATLAAKGPEAEAATRAKQKATWELKRLLPSEKKERTPEQNRIKGLKRKAALAARPRHKCSYCSSDFAYKAVALKHEVSCKCRSL